MLIFIDVPDFIKQNDVLHKAWVQKWEEIVSNSFDLSEVKQFC